MALRFGKKTADNGDNGKQPPAFEPQPEKARKWFEHAKAAAERSQYDYALNLYADGIKLDPAVMPAHEAMYEVARKYLNEGGRAASGREVRKIDGSHPVEKFAAAEFAWMKDLNSPQAALRFLESAVKALPWGTDEVGRWHAPRVLNVLRNQKKISKSALVSAKDLFPRIGAWNEAIGAGEEALRLDPQDAELQNELMDLAAQRAMDEGRYDEAGDEGGFRKFVRDPDKQRELEETEAIAKGLDVDQRNLERARRAYEESPQTPDVINRYGQLLKAQGTAEALDQAHQVFMKGFEDTRQYRFRAAAGDLRIDRERARVEELREKLEGDGADEQAKAQYEDARKKLLELQYQEYGERVREYPTDRRLKHRLGEVEFELGRYEEAMQCFQEAKDDPKVRVRAAYMLGRCFASEGWHDIAIQEFKEALERIEPGERETELAIRYDLMVSLMEHARQDKSLELAREALEICSSIARKDITYRDIRTRRKEADELVRELTAGGGD